MPLAHPAEDVARPRRRTLLRGVPRARLPVVLVNVAGGTGRADRRRPVSDARFARRVGRPGARLDAQPDDLRITKYAREPFTGPGPPTVARPRGHPVVLTGIATSAGVESTARAAHEQGFNVTLPVRRDDRHGRGAARHSVTIIFPRMGRPVRRPSVMTPSPPDVTPSTEPPPGAGRRTGAAAPSGGASPRRRLCGVDSQPDQQLDARDRAGRRSASTSRAGPAATACLISVLYLCSAVAQPTMGKLSNLFGPRRVFLTGVAICWSAGSWRHAAPAFGFLLVSRALIGIGTSACSPDRDGAGPANAPTSPAPVCRAASSATSRSPRRSRSTVVGLPLGGFLLGRSAGGRSSW